MIVLFLFVIFIIYKVGQIAQKDVVNNPEPPSCPPHLWSWKDVPGSGGGYSSCDKCHQRPGQLGH